MNKTLKYTSGFIVWSFVLLLPILIYEQITTNATVISYLRTWFIVEYALLIIFYFLNTQLFIPRFLAKQKTRSFLTAGVITIISLTILLLIVQKLFYKLSIDFELRLLITLLSFTLIFGSSTLSYIIEKWYLSEEQKKSITLDQIKTELAFLKAQINPHFLFNTLSNIYVLAIKQSEQTPDAVMKLSSLMRYVLSEAQSATVPLEKEINYLRQFIDLQKIRFTDKMNVDFNVTGTIQQHEIAPLILIPFIENAIKYGISTSENSSINIHLTLVDNILLLRTDNSIYNTDNIVSTTTGIGLKNVKRRLDLLYPDKHELIIKQQENKFYVEFKLIL